MAVLILESIRALRRHCQQKRTEVVHQLLIHLYHLLISKVKQRLFPKPRSPNDGNRTCSRPPALPNPEARIALNHPTVAHRRRPCDLQACHLHPRFKLRHSLRQSSKASQADASPHVTYCLPAQLCLPSLRQDLVDRDVLTRGWAQVLEWLSRTAVMHDSTPKAVNQPALNDSDHCSHALTYDLDDPTLDLCVGYQLLGYYILLLLKPSPAITMISDVPFVLSLLFHLIMSVLCLT